MKQAKSCGNADGCNSKNSQAWLWVAVTPLVTFFQITLSRCTDTAKNLLGENFGGILNERPICGIQLGRLGATTIMLGTLKTRIH